MISTNVLPQYKLKYLTIGSGVVMKCSLNFHSHWVRKA